MTTFQTAPRGIDFSQAKSGARPFLKAYPGTGRLPKAAKNNPGVLQSYVTYDTLRKRLNFADDPISTIRTGKALQ
jgi:hypothetical protein